MVHLLVNGGARAPTDPHVEAFVAATQECSGHDAQWVLQGSRAPDGGLEGLGTLRTRCHAHHLPQLQTGLCA